MSSSLKTTAARPEMRSSSLTSEEQLRERRGAAHKERRSS